MVTFSWSYCDAQKHRYNQNSAQDSELQPAKLNITLLAITKSVYLQLYIFYFGKKTKDS